MTKKKTPQKKIIRKAPKKSAPKSGPKPVINPAERAAVLSSVGASATAILKHKQQHAFDRRFDSLMNLYNQAAASNPFDALDNIRRSVYREAQRFQIDSLTEEQQEKFYDSVVVGLSRFQQYLFDPMRDNSFDGDPISIGPGDRVDYDIAIKTHDFFKGDDLLQKLVNIMAPKESSVMNEFFSGAYPMLDSNQLANAFANRVNIMKEIFRVGDYLREIRGKIDSISKEDAAYQMVHADQIAQNFFPKYAKDNDRTLRLFELTQSYWLELGDALQDHLKPALKLYEKDVERSQANFTP